MRTKLLITVLICCFSTSLFAQVKTDTTATNEKAAPKSKIINNFQPKLKLYGFIRNYFSYDSRESIIYSGEQLFVIPKDIKLDANGEDLNAIGSIRLLQTTTRLGLDFNAGTILNAELSSKIEFDFVGYAANPFLIRLRHAFIKMDWNKTNILTVGQTWHPMCISLLPGTFNFSAGLPYNPLSRTPQIQYNYQNSGFKLTAAIMYQFMTTSTGPDGPTSNYQEHSMIPEGYVGVQYSNKNWLIGAGVDILTIQPRTQAEDASGNIYKIKEYVTSFSPQLYFSYKKDGFTAKLKGVYTENAGHILMFSGYGATSQNADLTRNYAPLRGVASWATLEYRHKGWSYVLFGGYNKNLGAKTNFMLKDASDPNSGYEFYTRDPENLDASWRVSPSVAYKIYGFTVGLEYELTAANYGKTVNANGSASNIHTVMNHRANLMVKYDISFEWDLKKKTTKIRY